MKRRSDCRRDQADPAPLRRVTAPNVKPPPSATVHAIFLISKLRMKGDRRTRPLHIDAARRPLKNNSNEDASSKGEKSANKRPKINRSSATFSPSTTTISFPFEWSTVGFPRSSQRQRDLSLSLFFSLPPLWTAACRLFFSLRSNQSAREQQQDKQ